MRSYTDSIQGRNVYTYVVAEEADLSTFLDWIKRNRLEPIAIDTESTGLHMFSRSWWLRLVQFGTLTEAWVVPVEVGYEWARPAVQYALNGIRNPIAHNLPFDSFSLEVAGFAHPLWERGEDTAIMSHLLDPRGRQDGGIGQSLKRLGEHFLDPAIADGEKALKEWARKSQIKQDDRFREAPIDLPELEHYAGMDCIITAGLYHLFRDKLRALGLGKLVEYEYALQRATSDMASKGILVDVEYAEALQEYLLDREDELEQLLMHAGIDNPNSNAQVRDALIWHGADLTVLTPSGDLSVSKVALEGVDHPLVAMVQEYGQLGKFRSSYVEAMLDGRDGNDRIHPSIRALKARTARMSISDPPLHQLPSRDALIRRLLVADPGNVIYSADYSQVELRILAEMSGAKSMIRAIQDGVDLHTHTADEVGIDRRVAKMANFLTVYGGGATKLAAGAKITEDEAKKALKGFSRAYPEVKRYSRKLQEDSGYGERPIVTLAGRRLPLDKERTYAALNYMIQSTARDVLGEAILRLRDNDEIWAGVMLPIHDEVIGQAPIEDAERIAKEVGEIMSTDFGRVRLDAEGEVYGRSWGHGYMSADNPLPEALRRFS